MADTFTTNLGLTKPEVGASTDTWGDKLNADLDDLDVLFPDAIQSFCGLTFAADRIAYATSATAMAVTPLTAFGRSLIDDANGGAARTTLGLGTIATASASDYALLASSPTFTGGSVTSAQSFVSSTTVAVLAATGSGGIRLRPNGEAVTTGQVEITSAGGMSVAGTITSGAITSTGAVTSLQNFVSSTTVAVLAATGSGGIRLRPNGEAVTTGQVAITSAGDMSVAGTITSGAITSSGAVTSSQNFGSSTANVVLGTASAGSVFLRPNGTGSATGQAQITSAGNMSVAGTFGSGAITSTGNITASGALISSGNSVRSTSGAMEVAAATNSVFIRPNGSGVTTNQSTFPTTGINTAPDWQATSDERLKEDFQPHEADPYLADKLELFSYTLKADGRRDVGLRAQRVRKDAPHWVSADENGILSLTYAKIALEAVMGLSVRVRALES